MAEDRYADRWLSQQPIYLTDMARCRPGSALSDSAAHAAWRVIDYRCDQLAGNAIVAGDETEAPQVAVPLGAAGWHAISVGAWRPKGWYLYDSVPELLVRLFGDETFTIVRLPMRPRPEDPVSGWHDWTGGEELSECFWKIADLSGRDLEVGQPSWLETAREGTAIRRCSPASLAYVKLVPLTDAEVQAVQTDSAPSLPLYGHNDVMLTRSRSPEELRRHLEPFADSDFTRIYWEGAMGDLAQYFRTRNRTPEAPGRDDFFNAFGRDEAASWRHWRALGEDPMQVAAEACHGHGLEFHVCHRLGGFRLPPVHDFWDHGDSLYRLHPEWHGRDIDGNPTPRLSFAFPEVRRHVIDTFGEMASYGVDGVCLLFNRRHPLVEYEQPVLDGYRAQQERDPRELAANDPTWLSYRASVLTRFIQELRETLALPITAIVMSDEQENLANGLEPRAWVEGGLVDTLVPYTDLPEWNHTALAWQRPESLRPYAAMTGSTACTLAPCFNPAEMNAAEYRHMAANLAAQGADAFFFWWADVGALVNYGPEWSAARRLGHVEEIETWKAQGAPSLDAAVTPIRVFGGWDSSYVTPA